MITDPRWGSTTWTNSECERLNELWNNGASFTTIAVLMGKTKGQVVGRANRMGLSRRTCEKKEDFVGIEFPEPGLCAWPIGHPGEAGFLYCGNPTLEGKSYCAKHYAIAYIKRV